MLGVPSLYTLAARCVEKHGEQSHVAIYAKAVRWQDYKRLRDMPSSFDEIRALIQRCFPLYWNSQLGLGLKQSPDHGYAIRHLRTKDRIEVVETRIPAGAPFSSLLIRLRQAEREHFAAITNGSLDCTPTLPELKAPFLYRKVGTGHTLQVPLPQGLGAECLELTVGLTELIPSAKSGLSHRLQHKLLAALGLDRHCKPLLVLNESSEFLLQLTLPGSEAETLCVKGSLKATWPTPEAIEATRHYRDRLLAQWTSDLVKSSTPKLKLSYQPGTSKCLRVCLLSGGGQEVLASSGRFKLDSARKLITHILVEYCIQANQRLQELLPGETPFEVLLEGDALVLRHRGSAAAAVEVRSRPFTPVPFFELETALIPDALALLKDRFAQLEGELVDHEVAGNQLRILPDEAGGPELQTRKLSSGKLMTLNLRSLSDLAAGYEFLERQHTELVKFRSQVSAVSGAKLPFTRQDVSVDLTRLPEHAHPCLKLEQKGSTVPATYIPLPELSSLRVKPALTAGMLEQIILADPLFSGPTKNLADCDWAELDENAKVPPPMGTAIYYEHSNDQYLIRAPSLVHPQKILTQKSGPGQLRQSLQRLRQKQLKPLQIRWGFWLLLKRQAGSDFEATLSAAGQPGIRIHLNSDLQHDYPLTSFLAKAEVLAAWDKAHRAQTGP